MVSEGSRLIQASRTQETKTCGPDPSTWLAILRHKCPSRMTLGDALKKSGQTHAREADFDADRNRESILHTKCSSTDCQIMHRRSNLVFDASIYAAYHKYRFLGPLLFKPAARHRPLLMGIISTPDSSDSVLCQRPVMPHRALGISSFDPCQQPCQQEHGAESDDARCSEPA